MYSIIVAGAFFTLIQTVVTDNYIGGQRGLEKEIFLSESATVSRSTGSDQDTDMIDAVKVIHEQLSVKGQTVDYKVNGKNDNKVIDGRSISFLIKKLKDGSFLATLIKGSKLSQKVQGDPAQGDLEERITDAMVTETGNDVTRRKEEDPSGALYYCVAVICMYAFSILFMIGSSLRQNQQDMEAHCYLKEISTQRLSKSQDKAQTRRFIERLGRGAGAKGPGREGRRRPESVLLVDQARHGDQARLGFDLRRSSGESSAWSLYSLQAEEDTTPLSTPGLETTHFSLPPSPHPRAASSASLPLWGMIPRIPEIPEIKVELAPSPDSSSTVSARPPDARSQGSPSSCPSPGSQRSNSPRSPSSPIGRSPRIMSSSKRTSEVNNASSIPCTTTSAISDGTTIGVMGTNVDSEKESPTDISLDSQKEIQFDGEVVLHTDL